MQSRIPTAFTSIDDKLETFLSLTHTHKKKGTRNNNLHVGMFLTLANSGELRIQRLTKKMVVFARAHTDYLFKPNYY